MRGRAAAIAKLRVQRRAPVGVGAETERMRCGVGAAVAGALPWLGSPVASGRATRVVPFLIADAPAEAGAAPARMAPMHEFKYRAVAKKTRDVDAGGEHLVRAD